MGWGGTGPVRRESRQPAPPYAPWMSGCCWQQWWCHKSADGTSVNSCSSGSRPRDTVTGNTASPSCLKRNGRVCITNNSIRLPDQKANTTCKMLRQKTGTIRTNSVFDAWYIMVTWCETCRYRRSKTDCSPVKWCMTRTQGSCRNSWSLVKCLIIIQFIIIWQIQHLEVKVEELISRAATINRIIDQE